MKKISPILILLSLLILLTSCFGGDEGEEGQSSTHANLGKGKNSLHILSGSENRELEPLIESFANEDGIQIQMTYQGSVDIMRTLEEGASDYDGVWPASSIWISMGDTNHLVKHSQSTSISPVVFGIRKSLAEDLGFVGQRVSINGIMEAIQAGDLTFSMTSATQSNSGASAYLGFLYGLSGNPEILSQEDLEDPTLQKNIQSLLQGVERSSGSSEWLKTLFLQGDYDAMVNYESLIITTNQELESQGEEPLYVVYPYDGLSLSDSPLAYIDHGDEDKEEAFLAFQNYLLTEDVQSEMQKLGRRTGYEGVFEDNKDIFKKEWGIDTDQILSPIKIPEGDTLMAALNLYQSDFKKPSLSIYCLDFSGSMSGEGEKQVKEAMDLLLDQDRASEVFLQASQREKNIVIFFDDTILGVEEAQDGSEESLKNLNEKVQDQGIGGGTNMYLAAMTGLEAMKAYDLSQYTPAIIILSDGASNYHFDEFKEVYDEFGQDIPVFSILFGEAQEDQLEEIADYTNARVFDGRTNLVEAFRSVKGYN